jgi:hypothetical protein
MIGTFLVEKARFKGRFELTFFLYLDLSLDISKKSRLHVFLGSAILLTLYTWVYIDIWDRKKQNNYETLTVQSNVMINNLQLRNKCNTFTSVVPAAIHCGSPSPF